MRLPRPSQRTAAFTLMELMISIALLSMVMVIVTMSLDTGTRFNDRFSRQTDINNRANDILNKLAMQLRMASAGNTSATSLELPGVYPVGFVPKDPANDSKVKAYYFAVSTGLGGAADGWKEQYEPFKRMIVHDGSTVPGRLLLQSRDALGNPGVLDILSEEVAENGFNLTRVGNTLQMSVTLRSQTRVEEEIIYTALAQTLFLRSTLNDSSGSSASTFVSNGEDADAVPVTYTTGAPSVMFGNLITENTSSQQQVTLFITAPIGRKVEPKTIIVSIGDGANALSSVVDEGKTVTLATSAGTINATRATYPPEDQWPSRNGTYSVTLTGDIPKSVRVTASVASTDGEKHEIYKNY